MRHTKKHINPFQQDLPAIASKELSSQIVLMM